MKLLSFSPRPAHTLLYITTDKTFRIDTDRKGVVIGALQTIEVSCESSGGLPYCLETVIKTGDKPGRKLWLFYINLHSYTLHLPSVQVEGVGDEILEQALRFEYEALTGNSAMKNQLAYRFLGEADEMSQYWVTVVARETLTKLVAQGKKAGCKLGGLMHPGGLPELLSASEQASWLRIETWSSEAYALTEKPDTGFNLLIIPINNNANWREELRHWLEETGRVERSEAIMGFAIEYLPETDKIYHFNKTEDLLFWLGFWAKHLAVKFAGDVPLLKEQSGANKELLYIMGSGMSALLLCCAHFTWNVYQKNQFEAEYLDLQQVEQEMADLRKTIVSNQDKSRELKKQLADLGGNISIIPYAIASLQKRPAELLYRLANGSPEDLIIEQISSDRDKVIVSGVALLPHLPNDLAEHIEANFKQVSWLVNPPTKKDMAIFDRGGPWSFEIVLDDKGLQGFAKE